MRTEIFYWVLNTSLLASLSGLAIMLVRKIPHFPHLASYMLWLLPLFRFWMPFGYASRWSLLSFLSRFASRTVVLRNGDAGMPDVTTSNVVQAASDYFPIVYKTTRLERTFDVAAIVWAVVAALLLLGATLLYIGIMREIRRTVHGKSAEYGQKAVYGHGTVRTSPACTSPAVHGIVKPIIVVPESVSSADLPYILAHEQVHIRRRDNLWRLVAIATACVHWFNPLVWLFVKACFSDMELACDARALRNMGEDRKRDYAAALLHCAEGSSSFSSAFGGTGIRTRLEGILTYRRLTVFSMLAFGVLIAALCVVLLTNAVGG